MRLKLDIAFVALDGRRFCPTLIIDRTAYPCDRRTPHRRKHRFDIPDDTEMAGDYVFVAGRGTV